MKNVANKKLKILVVFVEPMLYGMDLIREVYEQTEHEYLYLYCNFALTKKDEFALPENSVVSAGADKERKALVKETLQNFAPDFVIINGYVGVEQTTAIRYCKRHKIPYAIESDTPLHIPSSKMKAFLKKAYLKRLLGSKYCYGFPGGTLQKENFLYYGIPEERCFIMPMSISEERFLQASETFPDKETLKEKYGVKGKRTFLFVGRLEEVKNVPILLRAFAEVKKENEDIALMVVGDGTKRDDLEGMVKDAQMEDVHFMGYATFPNNVEFYKTADVFVLPSSHEPWGLVVNEAMIMGLPVIVSSKVGSRKDLVEEGKNGYVFEDGNVEELATVLKRLSGEDLNRYSKASQQKIGEWNYGKYLQGFTEALELVCKRK